MQRLVLNLSALASIVILAMGDAALAQDAAAPGSKSTNCTCRFEGNNYHLGDIVCLKSPQGPQLAQCGMVLNNTSWSFTGMGCTISMRQDPMQSRMAAASLPQK